MSRFASALVALSAVSLVVLTGCGANPSFSNPTTSVRVQGKIFGGQQPVSSATVTVWQAGTAGYGSAATRLARTSSGPDGTFSFADNAYTCTAGEQVYITASGGNASPEYGNPNIMLATGLGDCMDAHSDVVEINEVTTVATAFALAQFFTPTLGLSSNDDFGTNAADLGAFAVSNEHTIPTLVDITSGTVRPNTSSITIEAAKIYSMANILAACVNDAKDFGRCSTLFANTTPPGGVAPTDTLQAAVQMALYPYANVATLFGLASSTPPFAGQLSKQPNDWTIGVSYTSSDYALGISGTMPTDTTGTSATSASMDIDSSGRIWFPTNLSGHQGVAFFDPITSSFNGPYVTGLLTQPQYVSIDTNGLVWVSDVLSNTLAYQDTTQPGAAESYGSFSIYSMVGLGPVSANDGGGVLFASTDFSGRHWTNGEIGGSIESPLQELQYPMTGLVATNLFLAGSASDSSSPCALEELYTGYNNASPVTSSTCNSGGMALAAGGLDQIAVASSLNQLCSPSLGCANPFPGNLSLPQGIATDGRGNEWLANSGNASVYTSGAFNGQGGYPETSPLPYVHDASNGNTMTTPYAIAIDGSGNVWIANAGCVVISATPCAPGAFVLSELIGAAAPTLAPLALQMEGGGALVGSLPGMPPAGYASGRPQRSAAAGGSAARLAVAGFGRR